MFSALITGIAIVHTTGMPVVYSFELGRLLQAVYEIKLNGLEYLFKQK